MNEVVPAGARVCRVRVIHVRATMLHGVPIKGIIHHLMYDESGRRKASQDDRHWALRNRATTVATT